ncbi:MAG: radical SAM protein, partial [bacterium]
MDQNTNRLIDESERAWSSPDTGWCWFQRGDEVLAYNPARGEDHIFSGSMASHLNQSLKKGSITGGLKALQNLDIPGVESMFKTIHDESVSRVEPDIGFLNLEKPRQLWIEVQGGCNEECIHCYAESAPADLPELEFEQVESVLEDAQSMGVDFVQFTGGDPLLWDGLVEAVSLAREKGITPEIYTNGLRLTEDFYSRLEPYEPHFAFSVYSHDAETHNSITQVPGS